MSSKRSSIQLRGTIQTFLASQTISKQQCCALYNNCAPEKQAAYKKYLSIPPSAPTPSPEKKLNYLQ